MLKHNCLVRFGIAFCLLLGAITAAQIVQPRTAAAARQELQEAMKARSGKAGSGVVLVIASDKQASADDEAYGDWADNLKSFMNSAPADIRLIRVTPFLYERLLLSPKLKKCPATVFIRDQTHALVYDGAIVEPRVYKLGVAFINAGRDSGDIQAFVTTHQKDFDDQGMTQKAIRLLPR